MCCLPGDEVRFGAKIIAHLTSILQVHQRFLLTAHSMNQLYISLRYKDVIAVYSVAFILWGLCLKMERHWRACCSRMHFNQAEEEYIDGEDTIGLGTLGKEGSGRYVDTAINAAALAAIAYTSCMCSGSFMMGFCCISL